MQDFADMERRAWLKALGRYRLPPLKRCGGIFGDVPASVPIKMTDNPLRARIIEFHLADGRWVVGILDKGLLTHTERLDDQGEMDEAGEHDVEFVEA